MLLELRWALLPIDAAMLSGRLGFTQLDTCPLVAIFLGASVLVSNSYNIITEAIPLKLGLRIARCAAGGR